MPINKQHLEFHAVDTDAGFENVPGYPDGITQKIIVGTLDEENKTGGRTRLLKFDPGVFTTAPFTHDYWEEVWQVSGDLIVGNDAQGNGGDANHGCLEVGGTELCGERQQRARG